MDTEKKWDEFEKNDSQFRKSESVQQDIQQILDTVTQIKTDVDQLKGEGGAQATGPADTEPALSAPEEDNQPPMAPPEDMSGAAPGGDETPAEPAGDLMAQPEDGAATPMPEEPAPMPEEPAATPMPAEEPPAPDMGGGNPLDMLGGGMPPINIPQADDQDVLLNAAKRVSDPNVKQQLLALVYQLIEDEKGEPAPPIEEAAAPMMDEEPPIEEILAEALDSNGDGMIADEEIAPLMRSADATKEVQCGGVNPADEIKDTTVTESNDEKKEDDDKKEESDDSDNKEEEKKDDDKKTEPGVNDGLPSKEEDKDSTEELPNVTEVQIETTSDEPSEPAVDEETSKLDHIIDVAFDDAKEMVKEQLIDVNHSPFLLSTSEMLEIRKSGGSHRAYRTEPVRKAIDWPDTASTPVEDKCRYFARSFTQMPAAMQDEIVTLLDRRLGSETTSAIFKSEGVDLEEFYEPIAKANSGETPEQTYTAQCADDVEGTASDDNGGTVQCAGGSADEQYRKGYDDASKTWDAVTSGSTTQPKSKYSGDELMSEMKERLNTEKTSTLQDSTESLEACAKSVPQEGVGMHIPSVSEMMGFKKSGTSMYTAISREAAEPHGIVDMGNEPTIPSVKEMFAKRFGKA